MTDENKQPENEMTELQKCGKERDEYLAGWQRAKADFLNYKKDEIQRLQEIAKYQLEDITLELIGVLDNFDLGLAALEKQGPVEKGIYMIRTQLLDVLKRRGLSKVEVGPGSTFDPSVMESVADTESEQPPGTVAEVIEEGYRLHERIIRPARVKISKSKK